MVFYVLYMQVLTAVGQGETVLKALQDAVPEDVREKLTTSVSGILHAQGPHKKLNELLDISRIPRVSSGLKLKMEEKTSNMDGALQDQHSSDQMKKNDNLSDSSVDNQPSMHTPSGGMESELLQTESSQRSVNSGQSPSISTDVTNNSGSVRKEASDSGSDDNHDDSSKGKAVVNSEIAERGSETEGKVNSSSRAEKASSAEETNVEEHKDQNERTALLDTKEEHSAKNEDKSVPDLNKATSGVIGENTSPSGSSSEAQSMEKEDSDNKNTQSVPDQSKSSSDSNSPTFNVSQALDAFTGMDDSTQVAVNSVFGVIEDMISHLEESSDREDEVKDEKNDSTSGSMSANDNPVDGQGPENSKATPLDKSVQPDGKESTPSPISSHGNDMKSFLDKNAATNVVNHGSGNDELLAGNNHLHDSSDKIKKANSIPTYVTLKTPYFPTYLFSTIPTESLDSDATNALLLEYFPEEGQWKLLEQPGNNGGDADDTQEKVHNRSTEADDGDKAIEPLYVILDTDKQQEPVEEFETLDQEKEKVETDDDLSGEMMQFVKDIILDALKVEVGRKLGMAETNEIEPNLARELEEVANAVSMYVGHDVKNAMTSDVQCHDIDDVFEKVGTLSGKHIVRAISSAVQETTYLRRILPVGVIVGSGLAALRKFFCVSTVHDDEDDLNFVEDKNLQGNDHSMIKVSKTNQMPPEKSVKYNRLDNKKNATVMVGAVTAALGASALLAQHQVMVNHIDFSRLILVFSYTISGRIPAIFSCFLCRVSYFF